MEMEMKIGIEIGLRGCRGQGKRKGRKNVF